MGREREVKTIRAMVEIYCQDHHRPDGAPLCESCSALVDYALARLGKCPWGEQKPVCANCSIHCYKPAMRDRVREVMRYAGPRMLLRHPLLALNHLVQKQKPAPTHRPAITPPSESTTCPVDPPAEATSQN